MIHLSGCGIQLVSKKGRLSRTPALHLLPTHAEEPGHLTLSSSSSIQDQGRAPVQPSEQEKEAENLPPRRPLKLAPLELPLEVREAQWQKIRSAQEAKVEGCKSWGAAYPRKANVCWQDGPAKSRESSLLSTITEPHKPLLPVNQGKLASDRPAGKEAGRGEGNLSVRSAHAPENICQSEHGISQSAPAKTQDADKRRLRLRRTRRLEEDHSKSSSSTADESKQASAGPGKGQRAADKAIRDASRVLQKASWRNLREPGIREMEAVGKVGRRMAVNDIQEAVL